MEHKILTDLIDNLIQENIKMGAEQKQVSIYAAEIRNILFKNSLEKRSLLVGNEFADDIVRLNEQLFANDSALLSISPCEL